MGGKESLLDKNKTCLPNDYILMHVPWTQKLSESTPAAFYMLNIWFPLYFIVFQQQATPHVQVLQKWSKISTLFPNVVFISPDREEQKTLEWGVLGSIRTNVLVTGLCFFDKLKKCKGQNLGIILDSW